MPDASHPDGHRQPRRRSQLGRKSEIPQLLVAEAGGNRVHLRDIPAPQRHYINSKASVLEEMALIVCHDPGRDTPASDSRPTNSLSDLGRATVDLIRSAAGT